VLLICGWKHVSGNSDCEHCEPVLMFGQAHEWSNLGMVFRWNTCIIFLTV